MDYLKSISRKTMTISPIFRKILHFLNLESEIEDFDIIHATIEQDIVFKGKNLWILMFAIVIASVGLNMNSTAVIIGAMLISPLMGPINGMGYSIATYNIPLFKKALKNFNFAVVASLMSSTAYFLLTPISTAHSELLARTSPTIYDVIIALFGGLAGIVAITTKQKGNVIPGVAIATALMPPLCTAGYGLATAQFNFFFGAFYLFTINTVFIAISSVAISQILKFPIRTIIEDKHRKRINRWITIIILLILIPSIYFGYNLVEKEKFLENAGRYIRNVNIVAGNYLLKNEINPDSRKITLIYGGTAMTDEQIKSIKERVMDFSIKDANIEIKKGLSLDYIDNKNTEVEKLKSELSRLSIVLQDKDRNIDSMKNINLIGKQILDEIRTFYPQIENCVYSDALMFYDTLPKPKNYKIIVLSSKQVKLNDKDKEKIESWLKTKLKSEKLRIFYE